MLSLLPPLSSSHHSDQLDDHVIQALGSNFSKKNTAPLDTNSMGSHESIEVPMHLIGKASML